MSFRLTRDQLYELVWSQPMRRLSEQIGISDVAIAKRCKIIGVPVPERGYWNKLQAGQKVSKTALPPSDLGTINSVEISGTLGPELRAKIHGEPGVLDNSGEGIDVLTDRFRKRLGRVSVPSGFIRTHPIIAKLLAKDETLRRKYASEPYSWNEPHFDKPFERRRLRFLNGLFLGFSKVGGTPWMRGNDARELSIHLGDFSVSFEVDVGEQMSRTRLGKSAHNSAKINKMRVTVKTQTPLPADIPFSWGDTDVLSVESQITDVTIGIAVAGRHLQRIWTEQQIVWRRQAAEEAERRERERAEDEIRKERQRIAAIEEAKRDALIREAKAWEDAATIRSYVAAVRSTEEAIARATDIDGWASWALAEADKLDPITSGLAFKSTTVMGAIESE